MTIQEAWAQEQAAYYQQLYQQQPNTPSSGLFLEYSKVPTQMAQAQQMDPTDLWQQVRSPELISQVTDTPPTYNAYAGRQIKLGQPFSQEEYQQIQATANGAQVNYTPPAPTPTPQAPSAQVVTPQQPTPPPTSQPPATTAPTASGGGFSSLIGPVQGPGTPNAPLAPNVPGPVAPTSGTGFSNLTPPGTPTVTPVNPTLPTNALAGRNLPSWAQSWFTAHPDEAAKIADPNSPASQYYNNDPVAMARDNINNLGSPQEKAMLAAADAQTGNGTTPGANGSNGVTPATAQPVSGGNFQQNQAANQAGTFNTQGTNANLSSQLSGSAVNTAERTQGQVQGTQTQATTNAQQQAQQQTGTQNQTSTGSNTQNIANAQNQVTTGTQAQQEVGAQQQQTGQTTTGTQQQTGFESGSQQTQGATTGRQQGTTQTTGTEQTTGTQTTGAVDALGFGKLLQGSAAGVQASDAARQGFLTDVVQTGGSGFNAQLDAGIRQALTGPQTTGAGDSARARIAGAAASNVARNNMGERLQAAQQLSGPTGLATLSTAANPYIGQTTATNATKVLDNKTLSDMLTSGTSVENALSQKALGSTTNTAQNQSGFSNLTSQNALTGSNTQNQATTGTQALTGTNTNTTAGTNTSNMTGTTQGGSTTTGTSNQLTNEAKTGSSAQTGFQNLAQAGTESQSGTATGASSTAAAGQIPQAQQVQTGGGGCIVCTVGLEHGVFRTPRVLRRVVRHKLQVEPSRFRRAAAGYFLLYSPIVKLLLSAPKLTRFAMSPAKAVVYEELRISGRGVPFKLVPWLLHWTWHGSCAVVGGLLRSKPEVTDPEILRVLHKNNVFFTFEGGAK